MDNSELEQAYELLKEKFERHEKILIQAYKSLKSKEQKLMEINKELEIREEELTAANEEITAHNENLDELVKRRSKKIEEQLTLFHKYAYLNAHTVRAPLARILGLVNLLDYENHTAGSSILIDKLKASAVELDNIITGMNRLLEQGSFPELPED